MKPTRGFAIVSAIFILVVLATLGAFIMNVSSNQHVGSALDVQGVRAYQAARAGVEFGLHQRLQGGVCAATATFVPTPATLSGFTVTVTCQRTPVDDTPANNPLNSPAVFTITSTACSQANSTGICPNTDNAGATAPGPFYVERRLSITF